MMKTLRNVLRLNAASCLLFGLLLVFWPEPVGAVLGASASGLLRAIGFLLLANAAHLVIGSLRASLHPSEILYFSLGDILWFIGSLALVGANAFVTTGSGQLVVMVVAVGVLAMGIAQIWLLAEATGSGVPSVRTNDSSNSGLLPLHHSRLGAIGASWKSMKTWIKVWLFALNGLFLAAIAFLPDPTARLTLACYVASAPLLAALMIWQRGLTRLLGLAHLIPWLPLVAILGARLLIVEAGDGSPPTEMRAYFLALLVAVAFCLVLDAFDCWRWFRGERFRMGSQNAAAAGASARTA